ncbi:alpha/beta fold hydrolase [Micromonospora radicis]|uniref:Alpha/beta fold hydrolase n=1 Tax=Micromonospora radicis TaxID=1894971 RepID=A0A418MWR9_9ACTN|nr:alpha/beta fold hydrolase [Micromonospora radicis]RIV39226.1 alpha/beta fold hydrolase [Micromonospora radicis]
METLWNALLGVNMRHLDVGGVRTRIVEAGSGPPLILLHGTGGHVEGWAHNVRALSAHFRVVAMDLVGHGLSDKPRDLAYVVSDYTAHVRALLAALGISRAHFAGVSLGAWVASWLAMESPDLVDRMVNCVGAVFRWPEGEQEVESSERRRLIRANNALTAVTRETVRARLHTLFHDPTLCSEELVDLRLRLYSLPGVPELLPKLHHMIPYDSPARQRFGLTEQHLAKIAAPTLYLWGEHNPAGSVAGARRAARLTPHGELIVIPDTGHWPQWERPAAFNAHVIEFLRRTES